jgi:Polysaccharide lyase family 8, super-sandwich domain/Polysaccharide lyase family 8, N terminal alpha-helical domain/Polysaccharide lyase family 8, C-terminal beta-sandwich domain
MPISRRALLAVVPATTLLAVAHPLRARAATAPTSAASADHATIISNTVAMFAGTSASNARPEAAAKLASIASTARTRLAALDSAGPGELFKGLALGVSDPNLTTSYQYLYEIALATRAPGAAPDLLDNAAVQRRVIDALGWLHDNYYGDQAAGYYGNWFNWEIGISQHVSKIFVLLAGELASYRPELVTTYVASMDAYLRNGTNGDVNLDSRFHTGANLADITANRILQGAVLGDDARVSKAIADQLTVFATVDPYNLQHGVTDGYYADGSFIQHASVAYTGSYGKGLLTRVVQTIKVLDGTSYAQGDDLVGVVQGWVVNGFAPLIFEGWMMEIVKGRAVSRTTTGYADVAIVVEAIVDLSTYATGTDATALKSYTKFVRQTSRATLNPASFVSPVSVVRYADILADTSIPAADLNPPARNVAFNAMDKTVHRRPGYAFALARSSNRISKYEYMSNENLMPWFQGDGAHYLYLSGQDQTQAFGVDYYTTVSAYRLAGVTAPVETRRTIPELYGVAWYDNPELGFTSSSESQNTYVYFPTGTNVYSGGATLGPYGAVGMVQSDDFAYAAKQAGELPDDFVVYRNADATKSWFMLDDEIVVLAAGIGDPAGRGVTTTIDSRIANVTDGVTVTGVLRDGTAWSGAGTAELARLRYTNSSQGTAVGYVFLDGPPVTVALDAVTRSRRVIRTSNPDTAVSKTVFAALVEQAPGAPHASMAYALVPNATEQQLTAYASGPISVLVNTTQLQAVKHSGLGLVAANAFGDGEHHAERLVISGPASVILRNGPAGAVSVAVSDPTMNRDVISVTVQGPTRAAVAADDGVTVHPVAGGTRIDVATRHAHGRTFTATLR